MLEALAAKFAIGLILGSTVRVGGLVIMLLVTSATAVTLALTSGLTFALLYLLGATFALEIGYVVAAIGVVHGNALLGRAGS